MSAENFSAAEAQPTGIVSYPHGSLGFGVNAIALKPKGTGESKVAITGAGGVVGDIEVYVLGTPAPSPTPTPIATLVPAASPTAQPTTQPTLQPTASPSAVSTLPPAVTLSGPSGDLTVGKTASFAIHQGSFVSGFTAVSSNTKVATVSVVGNFLVIDPLAPGTAEITVTGNGGQTASLSVGKKK